MQELGGITKDIGHHDVIGYIGIESRQEFQGFTKYIGQLDFIAYIALESL
jgi:hypothetical protein